MKLRLITAVLLPITALLYSADDADAQVTAGTTPTQADQAIHGTRAAAGETVWIVYNFVKPESRQTYIEGAEYRILRLLQKGYGEAGGERIFREQFLGSLDRAWVTYEFIQSPR